ncbi:hypothetical protein ANN_07234 [Periplaneta americana]|uniref:Uncharacterized protein n=1 Tax=Periplaneta americana TaxID=6978 RepID=A0ABQ8THR3_PERAM|nr:hypothetical protein ANN_07234 [Periplaneta americana]
MDLREVGYDDRDWINLAQDRDRWLAYMLMICRGRQRPRTRARTEPTVLDEVTKGHDRAKQLCNYLLIFRRRVYKATTARRFCHFCSPTLFDLLCVSS